MPSAIDTHELLTSVEAHDLRTKPRERRESGCARPGLWRTLAQKIMTSLTPTQRERHAPACETSLDRLVQEYPTLSLYAFARI